MTIWINNTQSAITYPTIQRTLEGIIYPTTFLPYVISYPVTIKQFCASLVALPSGSDVLLDVRKNGTLIVDSIFLNDVPLKIKQMVTTTNRARTSNVVTLTFATHSFQAGDLISVSGVSGTGYNGTFTVASVVGLTITYATTGQTDEASTADTEGLVTIAPTNGLYQVKTGGANVTALDPARIALVEGDVLWIIVSQIGASVGGTDLITQLVVG